MTKHNEEQDAPIIELGVATTETKGSRQMGLSDGNATQFYNPLGIADD